MRLWLKFPPFMALILLGFAFSGCSEDETDPTQNPVIETNVTTIDSYSGGTVSTPSGYGLEVTPGSIPETANNAAAQVAFSIETNVTPPVGLPAGVEQVGSFAKYGPDGFNFRWPVRISLPFGSDPDPGTLTVLFYNLTEERWLAVPMGMIDWEKGCICADVLTLGYYTLARIPEFSKLSSSQSMGGFEYDGVSGYYYTLTVKSVQFKYPPQAPWFPNLIGNTGSSGTNIGGGPRQPTHFILPQGTYEIWISRTKPGTHFTLPVLETYTVAATATINRPLKHTQMSTSDWTTLQSAGGGTWVKGPPANWPQPTAPMGTGQLQATLTWENTTASRTDLDLHLYGPDNMHVYYDDFESADGSIFLDIDWQEMLGNATENIYSVSAMPKGHYKVTVHHYSGPSKPYSVRVIIGNTVRTKTGVASDDREDVITEFDIQ